MIDIFSSQMFPEVSDFPTAILAATRQNWDLRSIMYLALSAMDLKIIKTTLLESCF